jgi:DDB1- and CUL4-associated factor 13
MRVAGGLDNGPRIRRGSMEEWKYIFSENRPTSSDKSSTTLTNARSPWLDDPKLSLNPLSKSKPRIIMDLPTRMLMHPRAYDHDLDESKGDCDPERPRIFHIYWSGPFTDKPYMTLVSYLYTQNLALDVPANVTINRPLCRPQFWVWINPGVQGSIPNPGARKQLFDTLAANPWSSPFLHSRFNDVIKFKLWNTTERLDALPELDGWRKHPVLGKLVVKSKVAQAAASSVGEGMTNPGMAPAEIDTEHLAPTDPMVELKQADAAQVVMSDLARFLVTHAFGGIYLDVDNVLLRDWEELWGWKGAFAMRWSVHEWYNTAILRMHQNSALGSFLLRTAMANKGEIPFHPFTITQYIHDAHMKPLLYRIPDALFDPDFLNMEGKQRDRPPFPFYSWDSKFEEFFDTPARTGAEASSASFDAFYRGAYAYHWHNNWYAACHITILVCNLLMFIAS